MQEIHTLKYTQLKSISVMSGDSSKATKRWFLDRELVSTGLCTGVMAADS